MDDILSVDDTLLQDFEQVLHNEIDKPLTEIRRINISQEALQKLNGTGIDSRIANMKLNAHGLYGLPLNILDRDNNEQIHIGKLLDSRRLLTRHLLLLPHRLGQHRLLNHCRLGWLGFDFRRRFGDDWVVDYSVVGFGVLDGVRDGSLVDVPQERGGAVGQD